MSTRISRPQPGEYKEYFQRYIDKVAHESEGVAALRRQQPAINQLARLTPEQGASRYAEGKWSVRQVIGHLADSERIFVYRMLCALRGDQGPLPSFDENAFVDNANFDRRTIEDLAGEFAAVREATLAMLATLDESKQTLTTVASGTPVSVRALTFIMAGHTEHHFQILRDKYGVTVD